MIIYVNCNDFMNVHKQPWWMTYEKNQDKSNTYRGQIIFKYSTTFIRLLHLTNLKASICGGHRGCRGRCYSCHGEYCVSVVFWYSVGYQSQSFYRLCITTFKRDCVVHCKETQIQYLGSCQVLVGTTFFVHNLFSNIFKQCTQKIPGPSYLFG